MSDGSRSRTAITGIVSVPVSRAFLRQFLQISVGKRFFANFNFTVLDEASVTIGDDCFIGPNVSIYTACHSTDPVERNSRREWAEPVIIGDNVWIGGSVTIGAGSVVTKDIPSNSIAVGNPCIVIKTL